MIVILLGTQKFQFNRLIDEIIDLKIKGVIDEKIFIQRGYSDVNIPVKFKNDFIVKDFVASEVLADQIQKATIVITHGGTSSIISALKVKKKVIVVPRLKKFNEHVDDHQLEIVRYFESKNYILCVENIQTLTIIIEKAKNDFSPNHYDGEGSKLLSSINNDVKYFLGRGTNEQK